MVRGRKGEFRDLFEEMRSKGFTHARTDGDVHRLEEPPALTRRANHDISIFVERKVAVDEDNRSRIADSVETALRTADGVVEVIAHAPDARDPEPHLFSEHYACAECGINIPELEPRQFSFNSPYGACAACGGLGTRKEPNPELVLADPSLSILEGVVLPWGVPARPPARHHPAGAGGRAGLRPEHALAGAAGQRARDADVRRWTPATGSGGEGRPEEGEVGRDRPRRGAALPREHQRPVRETLEEYMSTLPCGTCGGARLRPESLAVTVGGAVHGRRGGACRWPRRWSSSTAWTRCRTSPRDIAGPILKEVRERLSFLVNVGLEYLTLGRSAETLSGGEAQRIRLATQIGSRLVGVLYILDEPSIGLHQRDNQRLLETLKALRDLGNTVLVVEHDEDTIRAADHVLDLGPRAGRHGGGVIAEGTVDDLIASRRVAHRRLPARRAEDRDPRRAPRAGGGARAGDPRRARAQPAQPGRAHPAGRASWR